MTIKDTCTWHIKFFIICMRYDIKHQKYVYCYDNFSIPFTTWMLLLHFRKKTNRNTFYHSG